MAITESFWLSCPEARLGLLRVSVELGYGKVVPSSKLVGYGVDIYFLSCLVYYPVIGGGGIIKIE